jgi:predicted Zn-ribbon and HTH transcriptional regulator
MPSPGEYKTWQVLEWPEKPEEFELVPFGCTKCGHISMIPIGVPHPKIAATVGTYIILANTKEPFDQRLIPQKIRCRSCNYEFTRLP